MYKRIGCCTRPVCTPLLSQWMSIIWSCLPTDLISEVGQLPSACSGALTKNVVIFSSSTEDLTNSSQQTLDVTVKYWQKLTLQLIVNCLLTGLTTATISSEVFRAAQPALLYLVPFTLIPLFVMAYLKGDLTTMWTEPFTPVKESKTLNVWYLVILHLYSLVRF